MVIVVGLSGHEVLLQLCINGVKEISLSDLSANCLFIFQYYSCSWEFVKSLVMLVSDT